MEGIDKVKAELQENTARRDFTPSEIKAIYDYIHKTESKQGDRADLKQEDDNLGENVPEVKSEPEPPHKKPKEIAAELTGVSDKTVSKINTIFESEYDDIKKEVDSGKLSVHSGYVRTVCCDSVKSVKA